MGERVWPQRTGPLHPFCPAFGRYLSEPSVPGTGLGSRERRGEDSLAQAAELPGWALLLTARRRCS